MSITEKNKQDGNFSFQESQGLSLLSVGWRSRTWRAVPSDRCLPAVAMGGDTGYQRGEKAGKNVLSGDNHLPFL